MSKVEMVPHDPSWRAAYVAESQRVARTIGKTVFAVHHIGSTSIAGIYAKPVIDILVEVLDLSAVDIHSAEMESLGYQVMGEFGIPGRRYFRKDELGVRTHQIHIFAAGSDQAVRHLAFRDYLIAHPEEARAYSELKRRLAAKHPDDPEAYMDGKDAFIKEIDRRAIEWRRSKA